MNSEREKRYLELLIQPIRVCAEYKPRLGRGPKAGTTLHDFQKLYRNDPFYSWFGLYSPLMYAAHRAAGGMTSIYRQIGIGCERLIREILKDELELTQDEVEWSYSLTASGQKPRTLSLDARIPLKSLRKPAQKKRIIGWIQQVAADCGINREIIQALQGVVFEVRQGYKSKDSKRQNADIANAATAYSQAYLPCVILLSTQIDADIFARYQAAKWVMLSGLLAGATDRNSTYSFMQNVIGFDFATFFEAHAGTLREEVAKVLDALLRTE
ncbi:hypothetical protein HZA56_01370 [Candidatus Poribacteria bacterium]|nr:hypothetical protein [Candidatus Poribacteria bacterium]